jgi:hypothetical protein
VGTDYERAAGPTGRIEVLRGLVGTSVAVSEAASS